MPLLDELMASRHRDDRIIETLRFLHPAFSVEHRLVLGVGEPIGLALSADDPSLFDFLPVQGKVVPPYVDFSGRQEMQINLDAVSLEIAEQMDFLIAGVREQVKVVYANYMVSDPLTPHQRLEMTVVNPALTETQFSCNAVFTDPQKMSYPSRLYKTDSHPGLV